MEENLRKRGERGKSFAERREVRGILHSIFLEVQT